MLDWLIQKAKDQLDRKEFSNICYYAFPIKLLCKKLSLDEPTMIQEINFFTKKSIDKQWNMIQVDKKELGTKFLNIKI